MVLAMSVYAMSCFKLPKTTCDNLTTTMADFWWNALEYRRKIHWVSWEKCCLSKANGGLGFRDIECFNQALLAKQAWRLIQNTDCLFARIIKRRYYPDTNFLDAEIGNRPSFGRISISHGKYLLFKGIRKMVGNGDSIRVWIDPWPHDRGPRVPLYMNCLIDLKLRVKDLIDYSTRDWNHQLLQGLFYPRDIEIITRHKPLVREKRIFIVGNILKVATSRLNHHIGLHLKKIQICYERP